MLTCSSYIFTCAILKEFIRCKLDIYKTSTGIQERFKDSRGFKLLLMMATWTMLSGYIHYTVCAVRSVKIWVPGTCDTRCEAFIVDRMMMRRSLRKKASSQSSAAQLQPVMSVQLFGLSFNLRSTIALCHHLFLCKLQTMIMIIWFLGCLYRVVLQGSAVLTLHCWLFNHIHNQMNCIMYFQ